MGLVTVLFPLTTTGNGETLLQTTGDTKLVVNCKVNPVKLADHVKITSAPEKRMAS